MALKPLHAVDRAPAQTNDIADGRAERRRHARDAAVQSPQIRGEELITARNSPGAPRAIRARIATAAFALLFAAAAHAQSSTLTEAMNRGLEVRAAPAPGQRRMTPEQWHRRQLAAIDKSQAIMIAARRQPGLLGQYLKMQAGYDGSDELAFRMVFGQYLSWYQTFIGDYDAARATFSIARNAQADDAPSPLAAGFNPRPADAVIERLAQGRRAVFFNEAHSAPVTRTLTIQMLAKLRALGFDCFAAEALSTADHDLARRGYPTADSGLYIDEPIYGEMIRAALRLGYKVIAYDADDNGSGDAREKACAESLYQQTFARDPQARLVVNAGFGHIQKSGAHLGGASMAEEFAKISGIEPLSIEQTMLIEHARPAQDHPFYRAAMSAPHPDRPFVYVGADGKPWTLKPGQYDVSVFFPPETRVDGRPTWPGLYGARLPYAVDAQLCHGTMPCLIEARYANEGDDAVAADRVVMGPTPADTGGGSARAGSAPGSRGNSAHARSSPASSGSEAAGALGMSTSADPGATAARPRSVLYLYPGRYRLRASDRDDRGLATKTIEIPATAPSGSDDESR